MKRARARIHSHARQHPRANTHACTRYLYNCRDTILLHICKHPPRPGARLTLRAKDGPQARRRQMEDAVKVPYQQNACRGRLFRPSGRKFQRAHPMTGRLASLSLGRGQHAVHGKAGRLRERRRAPQPKQAYDPEANLLTKAPPTTMRSGRGKYR